MANGDDPQDYNLVAPALVPYPYGTSTSVVSIDLDPFWDGFTKGRIQNPTNSAGIGNTLRIPFADLSGGVSENSSATYASVGVLGRLEDLQVYTGATNRTVSMRFGFFAQGDTGRGVDFDSASKTEVVDPARWLDSLKYGVKSGSVSYPPPTVILKVGDLLWMRSIVKSCVINWQGPFSTSTLMPSSAIVECTFVSVSKDPSNYSGLADSVSLRFRETAAPLGGSGDNLINNLRSQVPVKTRT